jgi:[acyl-carrier-protein] S-malonyltransferase
MLGIDFEGITTKDGNKEINDTKNTQPLLVLSHVLSYRYFCKRELCGEDFMVGHSVGEYSALCIAGSVGIEECLRLVRRRGELM